MVAVHNVPAGCAIAVKTAQFQAQSNYSALFFTETAIL